MTYTPTGDRIFVRPDTMPEQSEAGLVLVLEQRPEFTGTVVALGEGPFTKNGARLPHFVKRGDRIVFSPSSGQELYFENEKLLAMSEWDVLAVIN